MSRINEVVRALSQSRRMYQRIMKRKRYTHFYTNEIYAPGCKGSLAADAEPMNILASCDNLEYMEYLLKEKKMQRALLHFHKKENRQTVIQALKTAGREDLIPVLT